VLVTGRKDVQLTLWLSADVNEALEGRHWGAVDDASKLDTEIVGLI
jgi:predicted N-acyltransferase